MESLPGEKLSGMDTSSDFQQIISEQYLNHESLVFDGELKLSPTFFFFKPWEGVKFSDWELSF